jgi:hypothetical protein
MKPIESANTLSDRYIQPSLLVSGDASLRYPKWSKWRMIISYLWNVPRIRNHRDLGRKLGITIPCEDALLAAFSACHLVGMTYRQAVDTRMLELLTKIWLAFVNLGDDILDEYVGRQLPSEECIHFANRIYSLTSPFEKAIAFAELVEGYLSESQRCDIQKRLLSLPLGSFQHNLITALSFDQEIDNCCCLDGSKLPLKTKDSIRAAVARLFDICIRSYELERSTTQPIATVDEVLAIYRLKSLELQLAYGLIAEAYLEEVEEAKANLRFAARARNYGAVEMMMSMFRDDVNDTHHDFRTGQPNLVISLASKPGREAELQALMEASASSRPITPRSFHIYAPSTATEFRYLRNEQWRLCGVREKVVFSYLLGVITDITTVGARRAFKNRFSGAIR